MSKSRPRSVLAAHRRVLASRLRAMGYGWEEVARRCGYENPKKCYEAVMMALRALPREGVTEMRNQELFRLDILQKIAWKRLARLSKPESMRTIPNRRTVDPLDPITVILKIMERRSRLMGLDAPERHDILMTEAQKLAEATGKPVADIVERAEQIAAEYLATSKARR